MIGQLKLALYAVGGMDCQILRDWSVRSNTEDPDGLLSRKGGRRETQVKP